LLGLEKQKPKRALTRLVCRLTVRPVRLLPETDKAVEESGKP
jgi:hypothetical protein